MKIGGRLGGKEAWTDVVEKIKKRKRGWDSNLISLGGRSTLVKETLSSIPLYVMSFMLLPKVVGNSIRAHLNFLWGGNTSSKKIVWLKWEDLCKSFTEGGLGIKKMGEFNKALVAKWVWRFLEGKENLWKKLIRSRHGIPPWVREGTWASKRGRNSSGCWGKMLGLVEGRDGRWFRDKVK